MDFQRYNNAVAHFYNRVFFACRNRYGSITAVLNGVFGIDSKRQTAQEVKAL